MLLGWGVRGIWEGLGVLRDAAFKSASVANLHVPTDLIHLLPLPKNNSSVTHNPPNTTHYAIGIRLPPSDCYWAVWADRSEGVDEATHVQLVL